jgi:hypothetical protein
MKSSVLYLVWHIAGALIFIVLGNAGDTRVFLVIKFRDINDCSMYLLSLRAVPGAK